MSDVKNYNPGQIRMDLPTANYIHELPLLSFSDIHGAVNLSLVFNYAMKAEGSNPFNIAAGYKLNLQKRLIMENNVPVQFQDESGKYIQLNSADTIYTFDDDSMRILRRTGSTYALENPDYSKEYYDQLGRITSVQDKYSDLVLEYSYSNGTLDTITYRGTKEISFDYSTSNTIVITYGSHTVSLVYSSANNTMTVTEPSGTVCTLTASADMGFDATVTASGETSSAVNRVCVTKGTTNALTVTQYVGSAAVDSTTYAFPSAITNPADQFSQVEITNYQGVTSRMQFDDKKLLYSYEIGDENTMFVNDGFAGSVQIHSVLNNASDIFAAGTQTFRDGTKMSKEDTSSAYCWKNTEALTSTDGVNGLYILSGWIKLTSNQYASDTIPMEVAANTTTHHLLFNLPKPPVNQWTYFAVGVPYSYATMYAFISKSLGTIETKDFRYSLQTSSVSGGTNTNHFYLAVSENVLIHLDGDERKYIPILGSTFTCGYTALSGSNRVFYEDLLRYKINQRKSLNTSEFYYNKGKSVVTYGPAVEVTVTDADGYTCELSKCYLGKKCYTQNGIMFMQLRDDDTNAFLVYETLDTNGSTVLSAQSLDSDLDVVKTLVDGVTTEYTWADGLITKETVVGFYERNMEYNASGAEVIMTDEFGNQTKYAFDSTWGSLKSISILNDNIWEPVTADEYDPDMRALTKRTFGSTTGRSNSHTYAGGNLSGLQTGSLSYTFDYTNGRLTGISKNSTRTEEHTHTTTQTDSYYPSQASQLHSTSTVFDKYGRLVSIAGVLTNIYDMNPTFHPSTGILIPSTDNGSALLATTTDEIRGETARFRYNDRRLLESKIVVDKMTPTDVIGTEAFVYDAVNRLESHTVIYDAVNSKSVGAAITYVKQDTDPSADSRVNVYSYNVDGSTKAHTSNTFDPLRRLIKKSMRQGQDTVDKHFEYSVTRVSKVTEKIRDQERTRHNYTYDAMGRIASDEYYVAGVSKDYKTYAYDEYGQLKRENNQGLAKTFEYEYNEIGNLTSVKAYDYTLSTTPTGTPTTTTFGNTYDKLTSFGGTTIGYNAMGCPTSYDGKTATWSKGKLSRLSRGTLATGTESYVYNYNAFGQRVSRSYTYTEGTSGLGFVPSGQLTACSRKYYYDHVGRLIAEDVTKTYYGEGTTAENIVFLYDESGIIGMELTTGGVTSLYYFQRNLQGDVIAIYDTNGTLKAKYLYDAWGNCTISSETTNYDVANANPIRYRGYYYDSDTGLYYCNARYYSPKWRRFISPDDTAYLNPENVNGLNLYCYCNNDPVDYADPSGSSAIVIGLIIGAIAGASIGFGTAAYMDYRDDGHIFNGSIAWYDYLGATLLGGVTGATIGAGFGYCWSVISSFAGSSFSFGGGAAMLLDGTIVAIPGLTVTGTEIMVTTGLLALGGLMLFASNNRPGNNRAQNKQYEDAARKAGYNPKDPAVRDALQQIHQYIRKNHLNLGWRALVELIKEWLD